VPQGRPRALPGAPKLMGAHIPYAVLLRGYLIRPRTPPHQPSSARSPRPPDTSPRPREALPRCRAGAAEGEAGMSNCRPPRAAQRPKGAAPLAWGALRPGAHARTCAHVSRARDALCHCGRTCAYLYAHACVRVRIEGIAMLYVTAGARAHTCTRARV
jgi:hypothetical protein